MADNGYYFMFQVTIGSAALENKLQHGKCCAEYEGVSGSTSVRPFVIPEYMTAMIYDSCSGYSSCQTPLYILICSPARYQGQVGASIIIGGFDVRGPHLTSVHPHGSTDVNLYTALGETREEPYITS